MAGTAAIASIVIGAVSLAIVAKIRKEEHDMKYDVLLKNGLMVDCISTDGGGIPRNVILPMGLALVDLGALSWKDFVRKTSYNPAQLLGLTNKGTLAEGKDADITVVDVANRVADMTFIDGKICLYKGKVFGRGGKVITTKEGEAHVKSKGLGAIVVNPENRGVRS